MAEEVSLKEYLNSRINEVKDSVKTASTAMDKRLEGMNEFRDQLRDQASRFVTREEMEVKFQGIAKDIQGLQRAVWVATGALTALQFLLRFFIK